MPPGKAPDDPAVEPPVGAVSAPLDAAETPPDAASKTRKVGIVFVHGIGSQAADSTLIEWATPLVRAISAWQEVNRADLVGALVRDIRLDPPPTTGVTRRREPLDPVATAQVDFIGANQPIVQLQIPGLRSQAGREAGRSQEWLLTEAWWSSRIEPPSFATMVDWCGRQGIVTRIARGIIGEESRQGPAGRLARAATAIGVGLFLSTMTTLALFLFGILKTVAAIVPIDAVKNATIFASFETFLTSWWGDMYVLLRNPVEAANIRGRVAAAILELRRHDVDAVVVIGHSGGTIVSYTALSDPGIAGEAGALSPVRADLLITHGEAINLARTLTARVRTSLRGRLASMAAIPTADRTSRDGLRVRRWVDFWANRDPAPSGQELAEVGQIPDTDHPEVVSRPIWNRMSISEDHGGYWENDEEFVLPVMREIDVAGLAPATGPSRFEAPIRPAGIVDPWVARHRQRVWMLAFWRRLMFVIPFAAILLAILRPNGFFTAVAGAAGEAFAFVGGKAAWDGVVSIVRPVLPGWFADLQPIAIILAMAAFALVIMAALAHATGQLGRRAETFGSQAGWLTAAEWILSLIAPAAALLVIAGGGHAPYPPTITCRTFGDLGPIAGGEWCLDRYGLGATGGALAAVIILVWLLTHPPSGEASGSVPQRSMLAGMLTGGAVLFVAAVFGAFATDGQTRIWVVGTVAAALVFRRIDALGTRRWVRWDENEREAARRYDATPPDRTWPAIQGVVLLIGTLLVATGIAVAPERILGSEGWVILIVGIGWFWVSSVVMTIVDGARSETSPTGSS